MVVWLYVVCCPVVNYSYSIVSISMESKEHTKVVKKFCISQVEYFQTTSDTATE